jgi:hypothetical protein
MYLLKRRELNFGQELKGISSNQISKLGKLFIQRKRSALFLFIGLSINFISAQTCPVGSAVAATGYGVLAAGGNLSPANATGTILPLTTGLTTANSASLSTGIPLVIDLQKWVAQGSSLTISWARSAGTPTATVEYSNDSITYTSLGSLSGAINANALRPTFTVPSGGLRYVRITRTAGTLFIDGVMRTHTCYNPINAIADTRVFMNPGTGRGFVGLNDINIDHDLKKYTPGYLTVANGTLTFDTFGYYRYTPNTGFDGVDYFSYRVCDAGLDGNINTTLDNTCDTAVVLLRSLFNCDSTQFFMPIPENEAMDFLEDIQVVNSDPVQFYAGLSVSSDAIVVYDQWEDGFETNIKAPIQASTKIWGDGDLSNGVAPGFPTDILDAGKAIILSNVIKTGHTGATNYDPNAAGKDDTLRNYVDYDGGDKMFIAGVAALAKFSWGTTIGTLSMSGSSVPAVSKWDTLYTLPIGQGTTNGGISVEISNISIMAKENNTIIRIDRDANGTVDIRDTLSMGETRYVDSRFNGGVVTVNQGATVRSNKPVMATLMTGDFQTPSPGYEGRTYSLIPNSQLSTCHYMPGVTGISMRVFLYNPTSTAITITRTTTTGGGGTTTINVPANSSNSELIAASGFGYRYCSTVGFAMITSVDHNGYTSDWGFTPVPAANLTPKVLMSIGAGCDPTHASYGSFNYEQALVTATANTFLYVDATGDGIPDRVSFNSDVDAADAAITIGGVSYNETTSNNGIALSAYQTIAIGSTSGNLNGANFWTKTGANNTGTDGANIVLVWGQTIGTPAGAPNIDAGYTVPNVKPFIGGTSIIKTTDSICAGSNLDSITVKFSGVSPYRIFWFNESTNAFNTSTITKDSFVIKNLQAGSYLIKVKDANCNTFQQRTVLYSRTSGCTFTVTGRLFNDTNGLVNSLIDGRGFGNPSSTSMYVYLVDNLGLVVDSSLLNPLNGTYSLTGVRLSSYTLRLSTTAAGIGATGPSASLPSGWVNTGEQYGTGNTAGTGIESGTPNGNIGLTITSNNITNVNLGIERPPVNTVQTYNISTPSFNLNDTMRLNRGGLAPGVLSASDPEDGNLGTGGKVIVYAPNQNELFYDANSDGVLNVGEKITDSLVISNFNPSRLIVKYSQINTTNLSFQYRFMDAANRVGAKASYTISWLIPLPVVFTTFKSDCIDGGRIITCVTNSIDGGVLTFESSANGINWMTAKEFKLTNSSSENLSYVFKDLHVESLVYYRIKLKDLQGHLKYSSILRSACDNNGGNLLAIYPIPSNNHVYVQGLSVESGAEIKVISALGLQVYPKMHILTNGTIEYSFDTLAEGIYTFILTNELNVVETFKVLILKQ